MTRFHTIFLFNKAHCRGTLYLFEMHFIQMDDPIKIPTIFNIFAFTAKCFIPPFHSLHLLYYVHKPSAHVCSHAPLDIVSFLDICRAISVRARTREICLHTLNLFNFDCCTRPLSVVYRCAFNICFCLFVYLSVAVSVYVCIHIPSL